MTDLAKDLFHDVAILVLRTPKMIGKPPGEPSYNALGEPDYEEIEISISGYLMAKTAQAWQENGIDDSVEAVFLCSYTSAIPLGSVIKVGDKIFHKFKVHYARGLMSSGLTRIDLLGEQL